MRKRPSQVLAVLALLMGSQASAGSMPAPAPSALRSVIRPTSDRASDRVWFDVTGLHGQHLRYDGRWCPQTRYELLRNGRFLGMPTKGGELCGYILIDRASPDLDELDTGAPPIFSPDGRFFVVSARAGRSDVDGLAVWEVGAHETSRRYFLPAGPGPIWRVSGWRGSNCVALSLVGQAGDHHDYQLRLIDHPRPEPTVAGRACGRSTR